MGHIGACDIQKFSVDSIVPEMFLRLVWSDWDNINAKVCILCMNVVG